MECEDIYLNLTKTHKDYYIQHNQLMNGADSSIEVLFDNISSDVDLILNCLNIAPNKCGYLYWKDAVFLFILSNNKRVSICNDIYPAIAKKYSKTAMSVERAMRICFENVMYYASKKDNYVCEYLKDSLLYPHNSEILARIVDLIVSKTFQENKSKLGI